MPVEQAALRVSTGARSAPHAMGGNPAALLTQVCDSADQLRVCIKHHTLICAAMQHVAMCFGV